MSSEEAFTINLDGPYLEILSLRQAGLCCSQIIVKLALRDLGRDNPELVRAMVALCFGSHSGGVCGVLTGAACALSLYLGKHDDPELTDPLYPLLFGELSDWFAVRTKASYGGIQCEEILAASPDKRACTVLLISTLDKLQSIIATLGNREKGNGHGQSKTETVVLHRKEQPA